MDGAGLRFEDGEYVLLGYVDDFYALLRAIDVAMPKDASLRVEGGPGVIAPEVQELLLSRPSSDPRPIAHNTIWPAPLTFDVSLAGSTMGELRDLAEHHAEPEVADHLVVYRGDDLLLWAHDAGDGYLMIPPDLPQETVETLRAELGPALTQRERGSSS